MNAPLLIFAWGNPSRGDDALGPQLVERIEAIEPNRRAGVECLVDFQLQVEHALDLLDRQRVLFVDASCDAPAPFRVTQLSPARDASFTTHAMTPQAILHTFCELQRRPAPPAWLLAIRGYRFALGEPLSPQAGPNLAAAVAWTENWLIS